MWRVEYSRQGIAEDFIQLFFSKVTPLHVWLLILELIEKKQTETDFYMNILLKNIFHKIYFDRVLPSPPTPNLSYLYIHSTFFILLLSLKQTKTNRNKNQNKQAKDQWHKNAQTKQIGTESLPKCPWIFSVLTTYSRSRGLPGNVIDMPNETSLEKTDTYFARGCQFQLASWLGVGFCLRWTLRRLCAWCCGPCECICEAVLLYPKDTVSLESSIA